MSVLQLRTFKDLYTAVREELQISSSDTVAINRIKRDLQIIYNEVVSRNEWSWLKGSTSITLPAYYSTGTASVSAGSSQVTVTTAPGNSRTGHYFASDNWSEIYRVESHTAASTTLRLLTEYAGATSATATYKIWTDKLPLPTDCKEITKVWHDHYNTPMEEMSLDEFRRISTANPRAEGKPRYCVLGDYVDPAQTSAITSLPAVSTRASAGVVKTIVFASSLPTAIVTRITDGDPVRWRVSSANKASYNGDILVSSVSTTTSTNDTITYTGRIEEQESATADTSLTIRALDQTADYDRYRELQVYPALSSSKVTLHVDYIKDVQPLENDTDEPVIPREFRQVLLYGALAKAWRRARNAEESAIAKNEYENTLARMEGKLQENMDKPRLSVSKGYLAAKRSTFRNRSMGDSGMGGGSGGGAAGAVVSGTPNTVAVFDGNGDIEGSETISLTELGYLNGVSSQLAGNSDTATLTNKTIVVASNTVTTASSGNLSATELNSALAELQTDIDTRATSAALTTHEADTTTHGTTGAIVGISDTQTLTNKTIDADANTISNIENADIKAAAAIERSKIAVGTADHVVINNGTGAFSSEATLAVSRGGTGLAATGASGNVLTSNGTAWVSSTPSTVNSSQAMENVGVSAAVAGNALTIALKQSDGSTDPAAGAGTVRIGFRSSTASSGAYNVRTVTGALSLTVSSGSTLGHTSGNAHGIWLYALDNSGTVELAVSQTFYKEGIYSTTAEGGAGAADAVSTIYSTTARANVPLKPIARLTSTQVTAGTWAAAPTLIEVMNSTLVNMAKPVVYYTGCSTSVPSGSLTVIVCPTKGVDNYGLYSTSTGKATLNRAGLWRLRGRATLGDSSGVVSRSVELVQNASTVAIGTWDNATASASEKTLQTSAIIKAAIGDTVDLRVFQNTGGAQTPINTAKTAFEVEWIGEAD